MSSPTVYSNRLWVSGAEHNEFGRNSPTDGNITISNLHPRTGTYAYRVQGASGVKSTWTLNSNDTKSGDNVFFFRGYLYITTLPASTRAIWGTATSIAAATPGLRLRSTGILEFHDGATAFGVGTTVLVTGKYYRIEIGLNTSDDVICLRIDGVTEIDWTAWSSAFGALGSLFLGAIDTVAATFDLHWDDLAIDNNDWCGNGRVKRLALSGAGTTTNASFVIGGSSPAATKYQSLIEVGTDDAVTLVTTSAVSGDRETYAVDNLPADCVNVRGLMVRMRFKRNGGTNGSVNIVFKLFGHFFDLTAVASTSAYQWMEFTNYGLTMTPVGGQWNNERINNLELGIKTNSANASDISALAAEVDYDDQIGAGVVTQRIFCTGWEADDATSEAIGGTVVGTAAAASNVARSGTYSLRVNPAGNTVSNVRTGIIANTPQREGYISCYIYVTARPTSTSKMRLFAFSTTGPVMQGSVLMDSAGKIQVEDNGGTIGSLSASAIPLTTWTRLDFRIRCSTTTSSGDGVLEVLVNGVSYSSTAAANTALTAWTSVQWGTGLGPGAGGCDVNYDDCIVDSTNWAASEDNIHVVDLLPTAAGALTGTGYAAVGQTNQWDCMDETPTNSDTDYVTTGTTNPTNGSYVTQDLPATAAHVRSVSTVAFLKRDGATGGSSSSGIRTNGHLPISPGPNATTAAYVWQRAIHGPSDVDGAWTPALVNASEIALLNRSANVSRCSNLRATVEYVLAGTAGPGGLRPRVRLVG